MIGNMAESPLASAGLPMRVPNHDARSRQGSQTAAGGECVCALVLDGEHVVIRWQSIGKPASSPLSPTSVFLTAEIGPFGILKYRPDFRRNSLSWWSAWGPVFDGRCGSSFAALHPLSRQQLKQALVERQQQYATERNADGAPERNRVAPRWIPRRRTL